MVSGVGGQSRKESTTGLTYQTEVEEHLRDGNRDTRFRVQESGKEDSGASQTDNNVGNKERKERGIHCKGLPIKQIR